MSKSKYLLYLFTPLGLFIAYVLLAQPDYRFYETFKAIDWISFGGFYLSAVGALFSYLALSKVNEVSERYFLKLTFPQAGRKIAKVLISLSKSDTHNAANLMAEPFFPEISVSLRAIKRTRGHNLKEVIERAEGAHARLSVWLKTQSNFDQKVNKCPAFWDLVQYLGETSEEIKTFIREEGAR